MQLISSKTIDGRHTYVSRQTCKNPSRRQGLGLRPAQDGAGLAYPASHSAQDGMRRRILRHEIIEHSALHIIVTTRSEDTLSYPYVSRVLKNDEYNQTVKFFFVWSMLTCHNKGRISISYPLDPNRCWWWQTHARRAIFKCGGTDITKVYYMHQHQCSRVLVSSDIMEAWLWPIFLKLMRLLISNFFWLWWNSPTSWWGIEQSSSY